jgi:DNA-binding transcriptional LysR family regulator
VLVCPPGTPLDDPVPLRALDGLELILPERGSGRRAEFEAMFRRVGVTPVVVLETDDRALTTSMVLSGLGSCITYRSYAEPAAERGAVVRSFSPRLRRTVCMVHRADHLSTQARAFAAHALAR